MTREIGGPPGSRTAHEAEELPTPDVVEGSKRRVAYVVNVAWFFVSHRLNLAKACVSRGWRAVLLSAKIGASERKILESEQVSFVQLDVSRSGLSFGDFLYFLRLISYFRREQPDLVHLVTIKPVIFGGIAARIAGVESVAFAISGLGYTFIATGLVARIRRKLITLLYGFALRHRNSMVIFQNRDDLEQFRTLGLVSGEQCTIIEGSGVDTNEFRPTTETHPIPVVVLPARMLYDKGVIEFSRAAGKLRDKGVAAEFWLAGSVDASNPSAISPDELKCLESEFGVRWLGHCDDIPALFARASIVCLPSYREGLPKALLEAASAGKPIVATDVPGCKEVVEHGVNGYLVKKGDVDGLVESIDMLLSDEVLARAMGDRGRQMALEKWDVVKISSQTLNIYESLWMRD